MFLRSKKDLSIKNKLSLKNKFQRLVIKLKLIRIFDFIL